LKAKVTKKIRFFEIFLSQWLSFNKTQQFDFYAILIVWGLFLCFWVTYWNPITGYSSDHSYLVGHRDFWQKI